jgi:hypothetical protein
MTFSVLIEAIGGSTTPVTLTVRKATKTLVMKRARSTSVRHSFPRTRKRARSNTPQQRSNRQPTSKKHCYVVEAPSSHIFFIFLFDPKCIFSSERSDRRRFKRIEDVPLLAH